MAKPLPYIYDLNNLSRQVAHEAEQGKPSGSTMDDIQLAIAERLERIAYLLGQASSR